MADSKIGDLLFHRGQDEEDNEDIWDDTALIKAYDAAVSQMKLKVAEENGIVFSEHEKYGHSKSRKNKKQKLKKAKSVKWNVGDHCRARFSEDSLLYEAEIVSIDNSAGTCFVKYVGYGNKEEQALNTLLASQKPKHNLKQESDLETDSGTDRKSHCSSQQRSRKNSQTAPEPRTLFDWQGPSTKSRLPPFSAPHFPGVPNFFFPSIDPLHRIPMMPPPPPPPSFSDMSEDDNEALCSMLMSWYMSGYHTGYYQGLVQGRRTLRSSSPFVSR